MPHTDKLENMNDWTTIFQEYKGEWVAIKGKSTVVAHAKTLIEARQMAREAKCEDFGLFYVPNRTGSFVGASL